MVSDKTFQQVTRTDSGEKLIEIQPINETQIERDLVTFVTTHSPSFISQAQNSSLFPEKNAGLFSSTPASFGSTSTVKSINNNLKLGKVVDKTETNMENNNSKDKQDVKPASTTGWNPPAIPFSSSISSGFNKPSTVSTPGNPSNTATGPKSSVPTPGFGLTQTKEIKPLEKPASTASLPSNSFGSLTPGTAILGAGVSQPKPSMPNTFQTGSFNMASKTSQDTKAVSAGNPTPGVFSSNPVSSFGIPKPNPNVSAGFQAPKSDKPLGGNNNGSNLSSQNINVTKSQTSIPSSASGPLKESSLATSFAVKTNPYPLPTGSVSNTGTKDPKAISSEKQTSGFTTDKNILSATSQVSSKPGPGGISAVKPEQLHQPTYRLSSVPTPTKPASVNPVPISSSGVQVPVSKIDSSNLGKVTVDKPISIIGQSYDSKSTPLTSQPSLSKPISTPVVQPTASKPILPEVIQTTVPNPTPTPPKVTQSTISEATASQKDITKPVMSQNDNSKPVVIQRSTPKPMIHAVNQSSASKPASSIVSQTPVTEKEFKKETTKSSGEQLVHKPDDNKTENGESNQDAKDEAKKPSGVGSKDPDKVSKVSEENDMPSKPTSQSKTLGKNLSVSFSEFDPESDSKIKQDTVTSDTGKPASGIKRSSEEITKKSHAKPVSKPTKKTKSGTFINQVPERKHKLGELMVCGFESSLELTCIENLKSNIVDVSCGSNHTLALTSDGDIYSWGDNSNHALGREGDASKPTKVDFEDEVAIVQIAAGNSFSAALADSGKVYAWGTFFTDDKVLGFYESPGTSQESPVKIGDKLPKGTEFTQIVAGKDHLLLLTSKGRIYAMGDMLHGQLGVRILRQKKDDDLPQGLRLNCLVLTNVVQIAAGSYHSFAINKKNEVYSWGRNNYCQCGIPLDSNDYDVSIEIPTKIPSIINLGQCSLFGGDFFSLALNEDGELYGFGLAEGGLLGVPIEKTSFSEIDGKKVLEEPEHILFPNSAEVSRVATGSNHSIVYAGSKIYSWGTELAASGHSKPAITPTVIDAPHAENILMLSAGYRHSTFLVASDDTMC